LEVLTEEIAAKRPEKEDLAALQCSLKEINEQFWEVEDDLRVLEKEQSFADAFVHKARQVYKLNDQRARLKYEVNNSSAQRLWK
jgi:hypothetical protein